jgi:hypothetical protein
MLILLHGFNIRATRRARQTINCVLKMELVRTSYSQLIDIIVSALLKWRNENQYMYGVCEVPQW